MGETNIAEGLFDLTTPVEGLHVHPDNARRGDVAALMESLERFGQVRPILARTDGTIIAGNHIFLAVQRLGWTQIAAVKVDISDDEARAYLLADNRLAELGDYDQAALGNLLEGMESEALVGTGFDEDAVSKIIAKLNPEPKEFKQHGEDTETNRECPRCGYSWHAEE